MSEADTLSDRIHEANIAVHKVEVSYYHLFHPEVYNRQEQERIKLVLNQANDLVGDHVKKALDFGAGTGNLTGKLLALGYQVTAVDISPEMCDVLRVKFKSYLESGKLAVINSAIEDVDWGVDTFDLVACYSVLHHLPDYEGTLRKLCSFLKKKGVLYLDHEASPYYWKAEPSLLGELMKTIYLHSGPIINSLYFQMVGLSVPEVDYGLSDYWHKKEHSLDHNRIQQVLMDWNFEFYRRTDYYGVRSWVFNPVFVVYSRVCRPDMSCWLAKK